MPFPLDCSAATELPLQSAEMNLIETSKTGMNPVTNVIAVREAEPPGRYKASVSDTNYSMHRYLTSMSSSF